MARKTMKKEVTHTTVKLARMTTDGAGNPQAEKLPDMTLIGNVSLDKAQKQAAKQFDFPVTVFGVEPETQVYELPVEEFLKYATVVQPQEEAAPQA